MIPRCPISDRCPEFITCPHCQARLRVWAIMPVFNVKTIVTHLAKDHRITDIVAFGDGYVDAWVAHCHAFDRRLTEREDPEPAKKRRPAGWC